MVLLVGTVGGGQSSVDVSWEMVNGSPGYSCHPVHRASPEGAHHRGVVLKRENQP